MIIPFIDVLGPGQTCTEMIEAINASRVSETRSGDQEHGLWNTERNHNV